MCLVLIIAHITLFICNMKLKSFVRIEVMVQWECVLSLYMTKVHLCKIAHACLHLGGYLIASDSMGICTHGHIPTDRQADRQVSTRSHTHAYTHTHTKEIKVYFPIFQIYLLHFFNICLLCLSVKMYTMYVFSACRDQKKLSDPLKM